MKRQSRRMAWAECRMQEVRALIRKHGYVGAFERMWPWSVSE